MPVTGVFLQIGASRELIDERGILADDRFLLLQSVLFFT
jgi:hypothetical protein